MSAWEAGGVDLRPCGAGLRSEEYVVGQLHGLGVGAWPDDYVVVRESEGQSVTDGGEGVL